MRSGRYAALAEAFRESAARGEDPPREFYTLPAPPDHPGELELVALMTSAHRVMQLYAFDPCFDPRRALRAEKERRVSLTNYLNFAGGGPRPGPAGRGGYGRVLALWAVGGAGTPGLDRRVDVECEHVVAAHDFRVRNPAAAPLRVQQALRQHALFWLDDGSVLSGQVYNLEQVLLRADEATIFISVCRPRFYGASHGAPWGRGLPYLALNRRNVAAKKMAATLEELETYLALERGWQPPGFAPEQLQSWDGFPEEIRRAALAAG